MNMSFYSKIIPVGRANFLDHKLSQYELKKKEPTNGNFSRDCPSSNNGYLIVRVFIYVTEQLIIKLFSYDFRTNWHACDIYAWRGMQYITLLESI